MIWLLILGVAACAQDLRVYSEFTRIDPFGNIVRADRGAPPREILSSAVPRNGHSTFRVVVSGPTGTEYSLFAGQNPDDAVGLEMYREIYVKSADEWIPDSLERTELPFKGRLEHTAQIFLMDLRVERNAPVRRIKVEPELLISGGWITYPMEVRVIAAVIPPGAGVSPVLPKLALPPDANVTAVYSALLCDTPTSDEPPISTATPPMPIPSASARNTGIVAIMTAATPEGTRCSAQNDSP